MILVLGVGRSGTSDCAKILRELGVNMGHQFHLPDEFNPEGYFEDKEFQGLNMAWVMFFKDNPEGIEMWRDRLNKLISQRKGLWGFKDPGIADFPELLDEYMKYNPKIVLCSRNKEDTIRSLKKFKQLGKRAEEIYENRLNNIKNALRGRDYLEIDCYADNKKELLTRWILG